MSQQEVKYKQGMTIIWSDGDKLTISNDAGTRWVEQNVDQVFGVGEWAKIKEAIYFEVDHVKSKENLIKRYECVSGYIPLRVTEDLKEELPEDVKKANALEELRDA